MAGRSGAALIIAGLLATFFLVLGFVPDNLWWGFNHLLFLPFAVKAAVAVLLMASFMPAVRKGAARALASAESMPKGLRKILLILLPVALFIIFRITVHSLGDGYLRDIEIKNGRLFYSTEMLDFFVHALVHRFLSIWGSFRPTTAMASTSIVAGMAYVFILFRYAPFEGRRRLLFIAAVASLGCSQLFFGYVESYTLVCLFSVWYLLLIFRPISTPAGFGAITVLYLLAGFSHQMGIILLPSFLYVAHIRYFGHPKRFVIFPPVLLVSILPLVVPHLIGLGVETAGSPGDYFLPFFDKTYGLLSTAHFFDLANEVLMTAAVAVMLLPFLPVLFKSSRKFMALTLIGPSLLFIFIFDPKLTMVRDWDLFSVPMAIAAIPFLMLVFDRLSDMDSAAVNRIIGPILAALILLGSWVALNNYTGGHLRRTEFFLDRADRYKGWGLEVLSIYYHREKDFDNELRILRKIRPEEKSSRYHGRLAQALWGQGSDIEFFRVVERIEPNNLDGLCKLGGALYLADSLPAAIEVYDRVLSRDSTTACALFGLAEVYYKSGEIKRARQYCRQGLIIDSLYPGGRETCREIIGRDNY